MGTWDLRQIGGHGGKHHIQAPANSLLIRGTEMETKIIFRISIESQPFRVLLEDRRAWELDGEGDLGASTSCNDMTCLSYDIICSISLLLRQAAHDAGASAVAK